MQADLEHRTKQCAELKAFVEEQAKEVDSQKSRATAAELESTFTQERDLWEKERLQLEVRTRRARFCNGNISKQKATG